MTHLNKTRNNIPSKSILSYGRQQPTSHTSPTPTISSYQRRTPMVYSQAPKIQRNEFSESEPLSPYSEMQIPMTQIPPAQSMNPAHGPYFHSPETVIQNQLSSYPQMARNSQHPQRQTHRMMDITPQRIASSSDVQASPCAQPSTPQTPTSLLPSQVPQYYMTVSSPSFNPEKSFVMRSTSSNTADWNVSSNAKKSENSKTATQSAKVSLTSRRRFLIGSIDQIVNWNKMAKKSGLYVIYEVTGILENVSYNPRMKVYNMIIRDEEKNHLTLQAIFFPIDRDVPEVQTGSLIMFVGRMIGARKLLVLNMQPTNSNSLAGLKRISFLCQRTLQEACLSAPEP